VRFVYFAPSDIQVARVDRQCIVNFCDALQEIGVDVELVAIGIRLAEGETSARNPLDLYRIRRHFPLRLVSVPVHQKSPDWWIGLNRFVVHAWRALAESVRARRGETTVLYAKNYGPLAALLVARALGRGRVRVVYEPHIPPPSRLHAALLRSCDRIAANTHALADELVVRHGVDRARVIGTHQGVDLELFDAMRLERDDARRRLGLQVEQRLVVYTGKVVWGYRETDYIVEAARRLADRPDVRFVVVGGRADHVEHYRALVESEGLTNISFTGFVAPNAVQEYQFAADLLLLYYPSGIAINRFRSPGKLFEYMAAGRPIVSVDLPVLREVLGQGEATAAEMVPQDAPELFAAAIERLVDDPARRDELARRGSEYVRAFTWIERARSIVAFIDGRAATRPATRPVMHA
jgi:glycosyltransferase involved in cell wall biosynthesis